MVMGNASMMPRKAPAAATAPGAPAPQGPPGQTMYSPQQAPRSARNPDGSTSSNPNLDWSANPINQQSTVTHNADGGVSRHFGRSWNSPLLGGGQPLAPPPQAGMPQSGIPSAGAPISAAMLPKQMGSPSGANPPAMAGAAPNLRPPPPGISGLAPNQSSMPNVEKASDQVTPHLRNAGGAMTYAGAPQAPTAPNIAQTTALAGGANGRMDPKTQFGDALRMAGATASKGGGPNDSGHMLGKLMAPQAPTTNATTQAPTTASEAAATGAQAGGTGPGLLSEADKNKAPGRRNKTTGPSTGTSGSGLAPGAPPPPHNPNPAADDDGDGTPNGADPDWQSTSGPGPPENTTPELTSIEDPPPPENTPAVTATAGVGDDSYGSPAIPDGTPASMPMADTGLYTAAGQRISLSATGEQIFKGSDGHWHSVSAADWSGSTPGGKNAAGNLTPEQRQHNKDRADTLVGNMAKFGVSADPATVAALLDQGYEVLVDGTILDPRTHQSMGNLKYGDTALASQVTDNATADTRKEAPEDNGNAAFQDWIKQMLDEAGKGGQMDQSQMDDFVSKQNQRNAYEQARTMQAMMSGSGGSAENFMGKAADVSQAYGTQGAQDEAQTRLKLQMQNLSSQIEQSKQKMAAMGMAAQNAENKEQRQWALDAQQALMKKQQLYSQQMMAFQQQLMQPDFSDVMGGMFTNILGGAAQKGLAALFM